MTHDARAKADPIANWRRVSIVCLLHFRKDINA